MEGEPPVSSNASKLETALRLHGQHQKPTIDGILSIAFKTAKLISIIASRSAIVHFFPISETSLDVLKEESLPMDFNDPTLASHACILYNPAFKSHNLGAGTFKKCYKGKLVIQPVPSQGLGSLGYQIVAIKRPYVIPEGKSTPTRLPIGDELRFVKQEATVWRWAVALLSMAYDFILEHPKASDLNGPLIPQLKFVQIGVAKSVTPGSSQSHGPEGGFLVEEYIPVEQGFTRFISNNSAQCLTFPPESYAFTVAQFCAFCQHVQWVLTMGRVFCTDWQGGLSGSHNQDSLLTDPQVMTHPSISQGTYQLELINQNFDRRISYLRGVKLDTFYFFFFSLRWHLRSPPAWT
ncbi:hypothetical protein FRC10_011463 [Ceratobasidium sp. 414]|nr:hypothetical protein FRC10_011463 [Ceratobasidium sp. 414]